MRVSVCAPDLFPVLLILNWIHCAAGLGIQHEVKASVLAEPAGVAEEGVLLVIIDGPGKEGRKRRVGRAFDVAGTQPLVHDRLTSSPGEEGPARGDIQAGGTLVQFLGGERKL